MVDIGKKSLRDIGKKTNNLRKRKRKSVLFYKSGSRKNNFLWKVDWSLELISTLNSIRFKVRVGGRPESELWKKCTALV